MLWPAIAVAVVGILALLPPAPSGGASFTAAAYLFYAAALLAALNTGRRAGVTIPDILGDLPRVARAYSLPVVIAPLLLIFALLCLWLTVFLAVTVAPDWASDLVSTRGRSSTAELFRGRYRTLIVTNVVLLGPFVEEYVFRGMLLRRWVETRGLWTGVIGSAAVFGILHPPSWIGAFATGLVLGVCYLWSRSLVIPVMIHVFYNGIIALVVLSPSESARTRPPVADSIQWVRSHWMAPGIAFILAATLIAAIVVPLMRQVRDRRALAAQGA